MRPSVPAPDDVDRSRAAWLGRGRWGAAMLVVITLWALLAHPRTGIGGAGGSTNTTSTSSFGTSSETQTTSQTVRVDTVATRLVATDPLGAIVADQTLPQPFADAAVQAALGVAEAALLAGPPASLFVKGPVLVETTTALVDASTTTVETGRETTPVITVEETIGPNCTSTDNRDVPNTTPCLCANTDNPVPPSGTPRCVPAGNNNFNVHTQLHTVIQELATTTETYRTTETYALRGSFLEHFVLYKVKGSKTAPKLAAFGPLTLTDALGAADYDVKKLPALGLPADKNDEGRADATTSLAQYALKRRKSAAKFQKLPNVAATNQCGGLTLTLAKPESLLVPVALDLATTPPPRAPADHEVDHFLCYKAKAQKKLTNGTPVATFAKGTQVDVVDDFQTRRYDLKKPTRLCVPVTTAGTPTVKDGTPVPFTATARRHPAGHLVCYQAKAASKTIPQNGCGPVDPKSTGTKIVPKQPKHQKRLGAGINGPLGSATLDTAKELELCIPSTASLP